MPGESTPAFPFNVAAGQKQGLWVDLYVPPGTPAGLYKGTAQVTIAGAVAANIPIQLTVRAFDLPSIPSLKSAYAVGIGEVKTGHYGTASVGNDKYWELLCLYTKELLLHHLSNDNITWPPPAWNSTLGKIDWSLPTISTTCNQRYPEFLSGGDPNLLPNGKLPGTKLTHARMQDGTWMSNPAFLSTAYYKDYIQHFSDMGWKPQLFYYLWDEPSYAYVNGGWHCDLTWGGAPSTAWSDTYKKAKFFKDNGLNVPIMLTTSRQASDDCFINYLKVPNYTNYLDIWTVPISWMQGKPSSLFPFNTNLRGSYDAIITPGKELWWYQACDSHGCGGSETGFPTTMADLPSMYSRIYQWLTYQYSVGYAAPGPLTELYYETVYAYQFSTNDPWKNIYYFTGNGDGTLFYPGRPDKIGGTTHIPIPSIRLKMLREGIEDYEYLVQVEAKKNLQGIDGKAWIKANILDPYMTAVDPNDGVSKLITYVWNKNPGSPTSSNGLLRAREELAKVLDIPPDFTLTAAPTAASVIVGNATTSTITSSSTGNFNAAVALSCTTSHPTIACSYNPYSVTPPAYGSATSTLTVTTQATTPIGSQSVTVTGASGTLSHPTTFTVNVKPVPDYQLAVSPASINVVPGSGLVSAVTVSSISGFNGSVALTCTPSNPAITCSVSAPALTPSVNGSTGAALNIQTAATIPAGSYSVVVNGVSGNLLHQATLTLNTTLFSDSFNRTNSTNLGANWNEYLPDLEIYGNQVRNVNTGDKEAQWTQSIGPNQDVSADCMLTTSGNSCGVMARWSDANNFYYTRLDVGQGNIVLFKKVAGTYTVLARATRTLAYNTFYRLRLVVQGSVLSVYFAGETTPAMMLNDTALTAGNYAGIRSYASAVATTWFDNFNVTPSSNISFSDSFDRADGTNLGANWNEYLPDLEISGNQLRNANTGDKEAQWTQPIGANQDVSADCKVAASGNSCGVIARWSDANNFYYARLDVVKAISSS